MAIKGQSIHVNVFESLMSSMIPVLTTVIASKGSNNLLN